MTGRQRLLSIEVFSLCVRLVTSRNAELVIASRDVKSSCDLSLLACRGHLPLAKGWKARHLSPGFRQPEKSLLMTCVCTPHHTNTTKNYAMCLLSVVDVSRCSSALCSYCCICLLWVFVPYEVPVEPLRRVTAFGIPFYRYEVFIAQH